MHRAKRALFVLAGPSFLLALAWFTSGSGVGVATPISVTGATCPAGWTASSPADFGLPSGALSAVAATSASDVWTVGYAFPLTAGTKSLIEHWTGSAWQDVSSPNTSSTFSSLGAVSAVASGDVWAVGSAATPPNRSTFIEHWNGSSWQIVPGAGAVGPYSSLEAVAGLSSSDAWATGYSSTAENSPSDALIEHWNGSSWQIVPAANGAGSSNGLEAVAALSASDAWAVGYTRTGNGPSSTLIEHWDGSSWSVVPGPSTGSQSGYLGSVSAVSPANIWIAGEVGHQALTEHWDGQSWQIVPAANPGAFENYFNSIAAASPDDVWAVGVQQNTVTDIRALIEHWDGAAWQVVPGANIGTGNSPLSGVVVASPGEIWAVGSQDADPGLLIEHLCGSFSSRFLTWGDTNCLKSVDINDVDDTLRNLGGLAIVPNQLCPAIGSSVALAGFPGLTWGDWTCDKKIDGLDAMVDLDFLAALTVNQANSCPEIGDLLAVSNPN